MFQTIRPAVFTALLMVSLWVIQAAPSQAAFLSLDPAMQTVTLGDPVSVDLNISDLGDLGPDSLSVFDVDIGFDPAVLSLTGVTFGTGLDILGVGSIQSILDVSAGLVNLFELSFEAPGDLNSLQPGAFTLATLSFDTIAVGASSLSIVSSELLDADAFPIDAMTAGASVTVNGATVVPLPAAFPLFAGGLGLLGLLGWRRKRRAASVA